MYILFAIVDFGHYPYFLSLRAVREPKYSIQRSEHFTSGSGQNEFRTQRTEYFDLHTGRNETLFSGINQSLSIFEIKHN